MKLVHIALLFVFLCLAGSCGSLRRRAGAGTYSDHQLQIGGLTRTYVRYQPGGETPRLMLLLLHGGGGKAAGMVNLARDMPVLADRYGIVILYPDGVDHHWNDGRGDISEAARSNVDDIAFMRALIAEAGYPQNITRVFAAGMSNGGIMAQRIACDMPDVVAGVVSVAANLPVELEKKCRPAKSVSVTFIVGVEDPIVPYHGGVIKVMRQERGIVLSVEDSLRFWSRHNNCTAHSDAALTANSLVRNYTCAQGAVKLIAVKDGGHAWPGGSPYLPGFLIGKTSAEFSASEKIVDLLAGS